MSKKKKYRIHWGRLILSSLLIVALIIGLLYFIGKKRVPPCEHQYGEDGFCTLCGEECVHDYFEGYCKVCGVVDPDYVFPDEIIDISLLCGGDVMAHGANIQSAYNYDGSYFYNYGYMNQNYQTDGTFDFSDNYQYIKPFVEAADLAMVNMETTFSTGGPDYSGYWGSFCAPDSLAAAVAGAGFDVAFTCNNHSLDYGGVDGVIRTVKVLRNNGLTVAGSQADQNEKRSVIVDVKGVKVGIVAYTYETSQYGTGHSLNGSYMSDAATQYLNTFRFDYSGSGVVCCDEDKAAIVRQIEWCRSEGADVVVCYFHWDHTNEYVLNVTSLQHDLAQAAANAGADIIFGSHPHIVQEMEILSVGERKVPVYYSLGNLISNQRMETMANADGSYDTWWNIYANEQEILAYLELSVNKTKGTVSFNKVSAIPIYVDKYYGGSGYEYRLYPLVGDYGYSELSASGNLYRADMALSSITSVLGSEYIYK